MTIDTDEQTSWLPDRSKPRFRIEPTEQLETELQSEDLRDRNVRLADISGSGAKFSIECQLQIGESIRLRLNHQEFGLEITLPATVRWCHLKRDTWEAGVSFDDAVIADDVLNQLAMDGVVERRQSKRHSVDLEAKLKTPGDPNNTAVLVSDISAAGACIFSPTPVEIGERLLLTLNGQESDSVSFVAVSRWQKQQGAGYQLGCQLQDGQNHSILETCGAAEVEIPPTTFKRVRTSWLTWTVLLVCVACTYTLAYPILGWPLAGLRENAFVRSLNQFWPW